MICDHQSKIKRSICDGILKLLDSRLITLDEDSQLKAIEFGLSDFVKLGWSSKLQVEVRWTVEETTKMSLMTKGYFHNLLDMLLDTTHMCRFSCVYELFSFNYNWIFALSLAFNLNNLKSRGYPDEELRGQEKSRTT
ncbi:hypothetical protein L3X38_032266 [Prunus dulcis]|uniref:Uncharacterized protein n=1 Tax=Prunus dulcis TaxID=3755 RepID=A0AAD4VF51_PRUDU|nr:hypothetical protein L3X38_032266 [Prunus dulcis]